MNNRIFILVLIVTIGVIMFNIFSKPGSVDISVEEFKEKITDSPGVLVDVRTKKEFDAGHLKITDEQYDFLNGDFQDQIENFDKNKTYYLYCRTGNRSGKAARIMQEKGFGNVYNVGGFEELADAGFEANYGDE